MSKPAQSANKPIVSSAHLAEGASPALSELEFSLTLAAAAFQRWMSRCATAAGIPLSPVEVLIVHTVRHRDRPKKLADITLVLDLEDAHIATYAISKLQKAGLVVTRREGKEKVVEITEAGRRFCQAYRDIRELLLVGASRSSEHSEAALSDIAAQLRLMSGRYNQAARAAATL
ncbi:MAG: winged helix DNA-binding protein [Asticcacaulis sp.]|uniref:winged helix DNA-binding protein n=1 Tax=Asticcacaulis sp. TaxID=1872648 RepID=UPI0039E44AB0